MALSLQDICLLYILFRLNEFPVNHLALLPRHIRRHLLVDLLPRADILHFSDTSLFNDLDRDELQETLIHARRLLLLGILRGYTYPFLAIVACIDSNLCSYFDVKSLSLYAVSLGASLIESKSSQYLLDPHFEQYFVPKHLQQFIRSHSFTMSPRTDRLSRVKFPPDVAWPLLNYCNVHCAPPKLAIDCYCLMNTMFWKQYYAYTQQDPATHLDLPFIREFFSSVEELDLHWTMSVKKRPYIIMYNIINSNQPCLKYLTVRHNSLSTTKEILEATADLFCTSDFARPYQLESVSVFPNQECKSTSDKFYAQHIASIFQSIVACQMQTLRSVAIRNLSFCYDDTNPVESYDDFLKEESLGLHEQVYAPALFSSLNQLLKQPQFEALSIGKTPFIAACEMITTFLTTPTSHDQSLSIEAVDKEKDSISKMAASDDQEGSEMNESKKTNDTLESSDILLLELMKESHPLLTSQSLPETNARCKCLDLELSCSRLHSWLFTLPELKLKKLGIRAQDLTLVPEDMVIQAEHVAFTFPPKSDTPIIPSAEKFIVTNPVLKRLEFTSPNTPALLPTLNHCLSVLYQQGRGLEEIMLNLVKFHTDCDHVKDFFILVRDLSHINGITLVISVKEDFISEEDESSFFVEISSDFQERKIKKIVLTGDALWGRFLLFKKLRERYGLLTDELVIHST